MGLKLNSTDVLEKMPHSLQKKRTQSLNHCTQVAEEKGFSPQRSAPEGPALAGTTSTSAAMVRPEEEEEEEGHLRRT